MSFGFSVGDFIAVGEIIATLVEGLRETGGSKSDYQEPVRELQSLEKALKHVGNISPGWYEVSNDSYEILNSKNEKQILPVKDYNWQGFLPGSTLTMAIILNDILEQGNDLCPMSGCGYGTTSSVKGGGRTCDECGVWLDDQAYSRRREPSSTYKPESEALIDIDSSFILPNAPCKTSRWVVEDMDDRKWLRNIKIGSLRRSKDISLLSMQ
ncbi:hypothetical protein EAF00_007506 [Botryotinia globosa]|nr:hypothetical protein EAF00_007506 [Botryotinia globosa]